MVALVAIPSGEFIKLRDAIRASWSVAERKLRAQVALTMQHELLDLPLTDVADHFSNKNRLGTTRTAAWRF
jgi:hypothetical protein